jgi:hypothetical protein
MITAIQTEYRGHKFRSRLEARWAVFFDAMKHDWTYEPEGYELPSGWYLPDFYLKGFDVHVEIKPVPPTAGEMQFGAELVAAGKDFILFYGDDPGAVFADWSWPKRCDAKHPSEWDWSSFSHPGMWTPEPATVSAELALFIATFCANQKRTFNACVAARQARFEHRGA